MAEKNILVERSQKLKGGVLNSSLLCRLFMLILDGTNYTEALAKALNPTKPHPELIAIHLKKLRDAGILKRDEKEFGRIQPYSPNWQNMFMIFISVRGGWSRIISRQGSCPKDYRKVTQQKLDGWSASILASLAEKLKEPPESLKEKLEASCRDMMKDFITRRKDLLKNVHYVVEKKSGEGNMLIFVGDLKKLKRLGTLDELSIKKMQPYNFDLVEKFGLTLYDIFEEFAKGLELLSDLATFKDLIRESKKQPSLRLFLLYIEELRILQRLMVSQSPAGLLPRMIKEKFGIEVQKCEICGSRLSTQRHSDTDKKQ